MPKEKKEMSFEDELFNEENIPESNWFKFTKIGDRIGGTLVGFKDRPAKEVFPASRVYELKDKNDIIWNVSIALSRDYVIGRANTAKVGDFLGFEFKKEIPSTTKGFAPAKSLEVYVKHVEQPIDEAGDVKPSEIPF